MRGNYSSMPRVTLRYAPGNASPEIPSWCSRLLDYIFNNLQAERLLISFLGKEAKPVPAA